MRPRSLLSFLLRSYIAHSVIEAVCGSPRPDGESPRPWRGQPTAAEEVGAVAAEEDEAEVGGRQQRRQRSRGDWKKCGANIL
jgi:hypothetical protein